MTTDELKKLIADELPNVDESYFGSFTWINFDAHLDRKLMKLIEAKRILREAAILDYEAEKTLCSESMKWLLRILPTVLTTRSFWKRCKSECLWM